MLEDYNLTKERKVVLVFDYMISDMEANKKLSPILTDLFQREEDSIFHLFLRDSVISKCRKLKD